MMSTWASAAAGQGNGEKYTDAEIYKEKNLQNLVIA